MQYSRKQIEYIAMIGCSTLTMAFFSVFAYREIFPEYKAYQKHYVKLEEKKAKLLGEPAAPFKSRIKQIVMQDEPGRAPRIDRCTSCHVALELPHFSPTRIKKDINGETVFRLDGNFEMEENPDYIWALFDKEKQQILEQIENSEHNSAELKTLEQRLASLEDLETLRIAGRDVNMRAMMKMHPLFKGEERPFQQHPIDDFGCSSCHRGNGRALTTARAHGPALDGQYTEHSHGHEPQFQESDGINDPIISKMYNAKPGHELLFQTTPLYLGATVQASCAQCHQSTSERLHELYTEQKALESEKEKEKALSFEEVARQKRALVSLLEMRLDLRLLGIEKLKASLSQRVASSAIAQSQKKEMAAQLEFLYSLERRSSDFDQLIALLEEEIAFITGEKGAQRLLLQVDRDGRSIQEVVESYFSQLLPEINPQLQLEEATLRTENSPKNTPKSTQKSSPESNLEKWLKKKSNLEKEQRVGSGEEKLSHYERGRSLFVSQSCYACHKVEMLSRGAVGPELTAIGLNYPWYIKESIVWPQADLASSTMPNFRFDHEEIEDLMTYLCAQKGGKKPHTSSFEYQAAKKRWEQGQDLLPWEKPLEGADRFNLDLGYEIFATEGCAACHRVLGFDTQQTLSSSDQTWFKESFPQVTSGRDLLESLTRYGQELLVKSASRGSSSERPLGRIEKMLAKDPSLWELFASYHSGYKFARRALEGEGLEMSDSEKKMLLEALDLYLKLYIAEYGLGRQIGPHLHYSGVYRSKEWLYEHFLRPGDYVAKSLMPLMPFDESKFALLTNFLIHLGKENQQKIREKIAKEGFDPQKAYEHFCAHCHGDQRLGNGPIAEWIYPIPKNLRSATFWQGITRNKAIESIVDGVPGSPMAPWNHSYDGNEPVLKKEEIEELVDWLMDQLPQVQVQVQNSASSETSQGKWDYSPNDVENELERDRDFIRFIEAQNAKRQWKKSGPPSFFASSDLSKEKKAQVSSSEVFERKPGGYYIKKHFFTPENIEKGKALYTEHCAHCHGSMGAGDGIRAVTMKEAKPRMLIHLPWISKRDDMRLLRAIKYGVAGTSMISFADVTTAWQRFQLVSYIRSLTEDKALLNQSLEEVRSRFQPLFEAIKLGKIETERGQLVPGIIERLHRQHLERVEGFLRAHDSIQGLSLDWSSFLLPFIEVEKKGSQSVKINIVIESALKALQEPVNQGISFCKSAILELEQKEVRLLGQIASLDRQEALGEIATEKEEIRFVEKEIEQLFADLTAIAQSLQKQIEEAKKR